MSKLSNIQCLSWQHNDNALLTHSLQRKLRAGAVLVATIPCDHKGHSVIAPCAAAAAVTPAHGFPDTTYLYVYTCHKQSLDQSFIFFLDFYSDLLFEIQILLFQIRALGSQRSDFHDHAMTELSNLAAEVGMILMEDSAGIPNCPCNLHLYFEPNEEGD